VKRLKYLIALLAVMTVFAAAPQDAHAVLNWAGEDTDTPSNALNWSYGFSQGGDSVELVTTPDGNCAPSVTAEKHSGDESIKFHWTHTKDTVNWGTRTALQVGSDGNGGDNLGTSMVFHDISTASNLTFWVKGASGGEQFRVALNSGWAGSAYPTDQTNQLLVGGVTSSWQQIVVPLSGFSYDFQYSENPGPIDLAHLTGVRFVVESGEPTGEGTVYIDDISFDTQTVPEPMSLLLLGSGLSGMLVFVRKR
jgi:hypothetical protein